MKDTHQAVRTISEIGLFAAIGYVIDELQGIISKGLFPNGGSIGFAMVVIIIIAIRRGWLSGIITGLIIGLFDFATGAYILHPVQALFDYVLPYAFVGLAGLLVPLYRKSSGKIDILILMTIVGGLMKFLSHYIAGVIWWNDASGFAWGLTDWNGYLYALVYNLAFIAPSIVLCVIIIILTFKKAPRILSPQNIIMPKPDKDETYALSYAMSGIFILGGSFLFVWFVIDFAQSVYTSYYDSGAFEFDANGDSMVIFTLGAFVATLGVLSLIRTIKKTLDRSYIMFVFSAISGVSAIYGLARLIRSYVKKIPVATYWIWFIASVAVVIISLGIAIMLRSSKRQMENPVEAEKIDKPEDKMNY